MVSEVQMCAVKYTYTCILITGIKLLASTDAVHVLMNQNYFQETEQAIGVTLNRIFNTLGLKNLSETAKTKKYVSVHEYFNSLTIRDYNDLQDIANFTRIEKGNISDIVDILNEILSENSVYNLLKITMGTENELGVEADDEQEKFKYLKQFYNERYIEPPKEINNKIIDESVSSELASNIATATETLTKDIDTNLTDEYEFWHEDYANNRRLFQGLYTKIINYPFVASIELFNKFYCGGSIIKSDLVITAASCLQLAWNNRYYRENPSFVRVRVGSTFFEYGGDPISVIEIYFYPDYTPKNLHHNIALLRLTRKINFLFKKVKKIKMDKNVNALPMNVGKITVLGWGMTTRNKAVQKPSDHKLKYSYLDPYLVEECQDIYSAKYVSKTQNFCAGYITKGSGACNRDVGGPGVVGGKLAGIISFGAPSCGTPDAPTVFVKIGYYIDWIEEIMEKDVIRETLKRSTTRRPPEPWPVLVQKKNTEYRRPIQRDRPPDLSILKKLLKTIFESKEIEDYIEAKKQNNSPKLTVSIAKNQLPARPFDLNLSPNPNSKFDLDVASISDENGAKKLSVTATQNNMPDLSFNISPIEQQSITTPIVPLDYEDYNVNKITKKNDFVPADPDAVLIERIKNALKSPNLKQDLRNTLQEKVDKKWSTAPLTPQSPLMNNDTDDFENAILTLVYMSSNETEKVARAFDNDMIYETFQEQINKLGELENFPFEKFKSNVKATNESDFVFTPLTGEGTTSTMMVSDTSQFEYK